MAPPPEPPNGLRSVFVFVLTNAVQIGWGFPVAATPVKCSSKEKNTMKMVLGLFAAVSTASLAAGQTLVGALAIDEGRGDQYG